MRVIQRDQIIETSEDNMDNQTVLKKRQGISPLWTLPILAIVLCAWLLYKSFIEAGIQIVVYFDDATGITPEKTQVMAMGIPFGIVKKISPDIEKQKVKVIIRMDPSTKPYLVKDSKFWIVKPEITARRITGLETILSGSYIGLQRGKSKVESREFMALPSAPPIPPDTPGLHIQLKSSALRSIQEGSGIYFRNIEIGSVQSYQLANDDNILINCFIQPLYRHLVKTGSRFYDASGLTLSGKLPDLKLKVESLSALLIGGIVVGTPDAFKDTPLAKSGHIFTLYENFEETNYGTPMTLKLASGDQLSENSTKVMYRGLEVGYVKKITFNNDARHTVTAHILLDPRADIILRENTRFWLVEADISMDGIRNLDTLISGPYITFQLGDGPFRDQFDILPEPPIQPPLRSGKTFVLVSEESPASIVGSPIYFHKNKVGELIGKDLSGDRTISETSVFIYDEYTDIISSESVFVESGGISIDASLSGFSINTGSLISTLKGGISILNPTGKANKKHLPAAEMSRFKLYPDLTTALEMVPDLKPEGLYLKLIAEDLDSYRIGSPILFKKIAVGNIIGFGYSKPEKAVYIHCFIKKQYEDLLSSSSKFYGASGVQVNADSSGLSIKTESLQAILIGGISFFTPPGGNPVKQTDRFRLFTSLTAAQGSDNATIVVRFEETDQLKNGAQVLYRGILLGEVTSIDFAGDMKSIVATLSIKKQYETFFREQTKLWLTTPSISFDRIKNIDNLIFGPSIQIQPGSGKITHDFVGNESSPNPLTPLKEGLKITLEASHLGSIDVNSPVYYRQVKVGEVIGFDLAADFRSVLVYVNIHERYTAIIRENTRFWNASGVTVKGGVFSGITVQTESVASLLSGGIALATPDNEEMGPAVAEGFYFKLYDKAEPAWLDWSPVIFSIAEEHADMHH